MLPAKMTPAEYEQAASIFDQVSGLPEGERPAALGRACAGNQALRAHVLMLLEADREAEAKSFLSSRAVDDAAQLLNPQTAGLLVPGSEIGTYRLGPLIGAGGMGEVYEGHDLRLGRRVAIKILPMPFADAGEERVKRFQRESRAASLLNHPNIVSIFDAGLDRGYYYIAAEFIEGKTLRRLVHSGAARIDSQTILDLIAQGAGGLQAAHEAGIVHRDIKPENIMVRPDGLVKILDFGLAKLREGSGSNVVDVSDLRTRPGHLAGTIQYLAPEQVTGKPVDGRSDLFSLGVVAYELATGVRPFEGPTDGAVYQAILNHTPPAPSALRPEVGAELDNLIMRALEKNPELRFQTAADLRSACKRLSRDSSPPDLLRAPSTGPRRRVVWMATAGAGLAAMGVFLSWHWSSIANERGKAGAPEQFQRLTDTAGEEAWPSLSPDSRQFVYASVQRGNWDIYLQRTGGATSVNLTPGGPEDDTQPAFSPDGSRIAFRSERGGGGLFVIESTGENPRRISRRGYLPAWAPDGRHIVCSSATFDNPSVRGTPASRLFIIDLANGMERGLNIGDAIQPSWSPHGERIAYWGISGGGRRDVFTVAASGKEQPLAVTADEAIDWYPVWAPAGDYLYFLSNRGGTMNAWKVAIDEHSGRTKSPPEPVTVPAQYAGALSISRNGNTLLYSQASQRNHLARVRIDPVRRSAIGPPESVAARHPISNFTFSPDGARIVYDTLGEPSEELWIMNSDGTNRRRLVSDAWRNRAPQWSPDGKEILFLSDRSGQYGNWVIHEDGGALRPLTTADDPNMQKAVWSPDGTRVLAGRFPGAAVVLDPRAAQPVVHPAAAPGLENSEYLLFNKWAAGAGGGLAIGETPLPEIVLYDFSAARQKHTGVKGRFGFWLPAIDSDLPLRWFVFGRASEVLLYDRKLRRETRLFTSAPNTIFSIAVSPDSRWIYFTQTVRDSDLWLARWPIR